LRLQSSVASPALWLHAAVRRERQPFGRVRAVRRWVWLGTGEARRHADRG
jgi:hypothetical protein